MPLRRPSLSAGAEEPLPPACGIVSSNAFPAANPKAMHQAPHSSVIPAKVQRNQANSAAASQSFFARLSSSFATALKTTPGELTFPSTPLEWSCRGDFSQISDDYWGPSILVHEDVPVPSSSRRVPSLTHSRTSSSDSAQTDSSTASFEKHGFKPLPPLPEHFSPKGKGRPASACSSAFHAQSLARQGSGNSISDLTKTIGHLDLAVHSDFNAASPASSSPSTLRRPISTLTGGSPRTIWTPRISVMGTPTLSDEAFTFESTLANYDAVDLLAARQEALDRLNNTRPRPKRTQSVRDAFPWIRDVDDDSDDETERTVPLASIMENGDEGSRRPSIEPAAITIASKDEQEEADELFEEMLHASDSKGTKAVAEGEDAMLAILPDPLETEAPVTAYGTLRRASIKSQHTLKLSGSGWRGWRAGSQPCTPVSEDVPQLAMPGVTIHQSVSPTSTTFQPSPDYFGTALRTRLNSISETLDVNPFQLSSSSTTDSSVKSASTPNTHNFPKLSPDFKFGGPGVSSSVGMQPQPALLAHIANVADTFSLSNVNVPRRMRAASANELGQSCRKDSVTSHTQRTSHRSRLLQRKNGTRGPSLQMRSFDAEALQQLRDSGAGMARYEWI